MDFQVKYAKVVGTPSEDRESWVDSENELFIVLEITSNSQLPQIQIVGREIIDKITSSYRNISEKTLDNIKSIVDQVTSPNISLVMGVLVNKYLYLFSRGAGRVIIKRQGKVGNILSDNGEVSGRIYNDDILLLTSPRFSEAVSYDEAQSALNLLSADEIAESLMPLIHRIEDTSGVGALVLVFKNVKPDFNQPEDETFNKQSKIHKDYGRQWSLPVNIKKIKAKIVNLSLFRKLPLVNQIRSASSSILIGKKQPEFLSDTLPGQYRVVDKPILKRKKPVLFIALILIVLLSVSLFLGWNKRTANLRLSQFNKVFSQAQDKFDQAQNMASINDNQAISLLDTSKTSLEALKKDYPATTKEGQQIDGLLTHIANQQQQITKTYNIVPELFYDINLINPQAVIAGMQLVGSNLLVLDSKNNSLYLINLVDKSNQIIAGGKDFNGATLLASLETAGYTLVAQGILTGEADVSANSNWKLAIGKDAEWGNIVDMTTFNDNLYLLDKTNNKIWKYIQNGTSFAAKANYLKGQIDLSGATSLVVDGSLWIAVNNNILKYTSGNPDNFIVNGLIKPLGSNLKIKTNKDINNIYILDSDNQRLVIIDKSGNYQGQYQWHNLSVTGFAVSESDKKMYISEGSKIYQIKIND